MTDSFALPFPSNLVVGMLLRLIIPRKLHIVGPNLVVYNDQVAEFDHSLLFTHCGLLCKVVVLVKGGSVIIGASPSSLK